MVHYSLQNSKDGLDPILVFMKFLWVSLMAPLKLKQTYSLIHSFTGPQDTFSHTIAQLEFKYMPHMKNFSFMMV